MPQNFDLHIEPVSRSPRLNDGAVFGRFFRGDPLRLASSPRRSSSALAVVASCLGVYVIFAIGYHWLVEPVAKSYAAADKAIPETVVSHLAPPAAPPELPSAVPTKQSPSTIVSGVAAASDAAETSAAVAPKKTPRKQAARTTGRRERPGRDYRSPWDFASRPSNGFRPWF